MTENKFATIDPKTGVVTVTKVGSRENDDKATVTVTLQLSSGKVLEATKEVYFYAYKAKLGDYILQMAVMGQTFPSATLRLLASFSTSSQKCVSGQWR